MKKRRMVMLSIVLILVVGVTSCITISQPSPALPAPKPSPAPAPALTPTLIKTIEIFPWGICAKPMAIDNEFLYVGQERNIQVYTKGDWKLVGNMEMKEGVRQILVDRTRVYATPRGIYSDPYTSSAPTGGITIFDKSTGEKLLELKKEEVGGTYKLGGPGFIAIDDTYVYELRGANLLLWDKDNGPLLEVIDLKGKGNKGESCSIGIGGYLDMVVDERNIYLGIEPGEVQIWDKVTKSLIKAVKFYEAGAHELPGFSGLAIDDNHVYVSICSLVADDFQVLNKRGGYITSFDQGSNSVYADSANVYLGCYGNRVNVYDTKDVLATSQLRPKASLACPGIPRGIISDANYIYVLSDYLVLGGDDLDHATIQIWEK